MVYNYQFVPLDKEVYCIAFRYGKKKAIVNRKPILGKVTGTHYGRYFIPNDEKERAITLNSNYYFADTYCQAAQKYNELVDEAYDFFYDTAEKIAMNGIDWVGDVNDECY